ncbi:MAG: hypothetical protein AAGH15_14530 [Myxococcota bacterium]
MPRPPLAPTAVLLALFLALALYGVVTVLLPSLEDAPGEGEPGTDTSGAPAQEAPPAPAPTGE